MSETDALNDVHASYLDALRAGDRRRALTCVQEAVAAGIDVRDIYLGVLQPAMHEVGQMWEASRFTVAQEHLATAITQRVMAQVSGAAAVRPLNGRTVVATCIGGELHELGIRMVADFFELEGWDVCYLGADVPNESVVRMATERGADVLAVSVTLSSYVPRLRELIAEVRQAPIGARIKVIVGGQPLGRAGETAASLGADGIGRDAREAIAHAGALLG